MTAPTPEISERGVVDRGLAMAETVVYAMCAVLLLASAVSVLVVVAYHLVKDLSHGTEQAVMTALDGLLLVFILLELVAGVRATMAERHLVAEPFLLVGMIASIKEIIVVALKARGEQSGQQAFENAVVEIAVLGALVLVLALATYLVRRKEREPEEGDASTS